MADQEALGASKSNFTFKRINVKSGCMKDRPFWTARIRQAWDEASIVWLSGVRRVGKTTLSRGLSDTLYLNCDLRSVAERLRDPERFYASVSAPVVVLDEVHQIEDPSRLLKVGADAFPRLKILATGSSTLAATAKFRDSLSGRKRSVHILPVLCEELAAFGVPDLRTRLFRGGLPEALLKERHSPDLYAEWLDSFYARDIQELFRVEKRHAFLLLVETVFRQSGGLMEVTSFAKHCGLSRPTVMNYIEILEMTHAVHILRPFHGGGRQEILAQPKCYGFDTGFVAHCRGWTDLRDDDCGLLWEHLVLDTLLASPERKVRFWRDKEKREIDFVLPRARGACDALECKWDAGAFDPKGLRAFRALHPAGRNFIVAPLTGEPYVRRLDGLEVTFTSLESLRGCLAPEKPLARARATSRTSQRSLARSTHGRRPGDPPRRGKTRRKR